MTHLDVPDFIADLRKTLVRCDSLLSCLFFRHRSYLEEVGEAEEMAPSDSYVLERSKNRWKCSTEDREYYGPTAEIAVARAVIEQYRKEA